MIDSLPRVAEIAAIVTALGSFFGGLILAYRGLRSDKFKREVESSAAILAGYTGIVERLQTEVDRLARRLDDAERRHEEDLVEWEVERERWRTERMTMRGRIDFLENELSSLRHGLEAQ